MVTNIFCIQKVSRSSLTRGGSQEDPAQLLRDLQDSLEREADLREQLRNAEEEVPTNAFKKRSKSTFYDTTRTSHFDLELVHQ